MKRPVIDEASFRALVAAYPFYAIAARLDVDTRAVAALAARYGLSSSFCARAACAEEEARVYALRDEGFSIKAIADSIGRSQDFVARRINGLAPPLMDAAPRVPETRVPGLVR